MDEGDPMRDFLVVAIALVLMGAAFVLASCGNSAPTPRRPDIVVERRECLPEPPPQPPGGVMWEVCGAPFAACLTKASALALAQYLNALQGYAREAYIRCGPPAAEGDP